MFSQYLPFSYILIDTNNIKVNIIYFYIHRKTTSSELSKMNVLVICLDSMSHLNYQRKLPKTYSYLKDTLGAVMLNAFNVVADGTLHNIVPLLTGKTTNVYIDIKLHTHTHTTTLQCVSCS